MINLSNLSDSEILGLTIIGEARGESITGQIAVGCVVRNRTKLHRTTYNIECLKPKQFSCWNANDPNYPMLEDLAQQLLHGQYITDPYLNQCMFVAEGIVEDDILDITGGAIHYMTTTLFTSRDRPIWADKVSDLKTIGNQVFFNV